MYIERPVPDRVRAIRERCRTTRPRLDLCRYKLITQFYMENPQLTGILKRAKNLRNLFENMPTLINDGELIVAGRAPPTATVRCIPKTPGTGS